MADFLCDRARSVSVRSKIGEVAPYSRAVEVFVSYSQNFEDVILNRVFKRIPQGMYIDIGAYDPVIDSVSLSFYERGWRGIHVEPTPALAEKLRAARPDEIVVQAIVGKANPAAEFYEFEGTGLSTANPEIAGSHRLGGRQAISYRVKSIPLAEVLALAGGNEVHWLKIDTEGTEAEVIETWGQSDVRPWVVVVESTQPLSETVSHTAWETTLVGLGYEFVYFDGLNRFYVSKAHPELVGFFGPGPNVFDEFTLSGTASETYTHRLKEKLGEAERLEVSTRIERDKILNENQNFRTEIDIIRGERDTARAERDEIAGRLNLSYNQISAFDFGLYKVRSLQSSLRSRRKTVMNSLQNSLLYRRMTNWSFAMNMRLVFRAIMRRLGLSAPQPSQRELTEVQSALSPEARQVYDDLMAEMARRG